MMNKSRSSYVTRNSILGLLSDTEVAAVSMAETAAGLAHGDEYVDLTSPGKGVLRADGVKVEMGTVLPRKSVQAATWDKVTEHVRAKRVEDVVAGGKTSQRKPS